MDDQLTTYAEGFDAFLRGVALDDNPYLGMYQAREWLQGWEDALEEYMGALHEGDKPCLD